MYDSLRVAGFALRILAQDTSIKIVSFVGCPRTTEGGKQHPAPKRDYLVSYMRLLDYNLKFIFTPSLTTSDTHIYNSSLYKGITTT